MVVWFTARKYQLQMAARLAVKNKKQAKESFIVKNLLSLAKTCLVYKFILSHERRTLVLDW